MRKRTSLEEIKRLDKDPKNTNYPGRNSTPEMLVVWGRLHKQDAIARAEDEAAQIEAQLADPVTYQDADLAAKLAKAYQQKKDEIDELYAAWEDMEAEEGEN